MTNLTDRYVWAVLRSVPAAQRPDLEPEIRALIADAADAQAGAGAGSGEAAERAALLELGDPEVLADRYVDRTRSLVGPRVYPEWQRLLRILLPIVVPLGAFVAGAAATLSGQPVGQVVTSAIGAAISVGIQTLFWVTLVFVVIERTAGRDLPARTWTPDQLPETPSTERLGIGEAVATVIANLFVAAGLLWVQLQPPIVLDGTPFPLFDPALWSFWLPWFLVVVAAEVVFAIALYLRGRWTWLLAAMNAALGAAFAIPALWLLQSDLLLNPALVARIREAGGDWLGITVGIATISVVAIAGWDAIDGFRKAWLNERRRATAATTA